MSPHQWNFSSHCSKPYPSSSATSMSNSGLNFSAAGMAGQYQPSTLRSHPTQPADLWPFPSIGTPSLASSVYHHALPDLHAVDEPISDRKYGSLLGLLQQERCLTSMQECTMKQHSSPACMTGPARLQNISQSSAPGGGKEILIITLFFDSILCKETKIIQSVPTVHKLESSPAQLIGIVFNS